MTKIKNTKKGMAKKTLSMSLVVAMLATSNVPVWAAEFSDGSDVAVETFSDESETAPVVEDTNVDAAKDVAQVSPKTTITGDGVTDNEIKYGTSFTVTTNEGTSTQYSYRLTYSLNGGTETEVGTLDKNAAGTLSGDAKKNPKLDATNLGNTLTYKIYQAQADTAAGVSDWGTPIATDNYTIVGASKADYATVAENAAVTITGDAKAGITLTAAAAGVTTNGTVSYKWIKAGSTISTGATYSVTAADLGCELTAVAYVATNTKTYGDIEVARKSVTVTGDAADYIEATKIAVKNATVAWSAAKSKTVNDLFTIDTGYLKGNATEVAKSVYVEKDSKAYTLTGTDADKGAMIYPVITFTVPGSATQLTYKGTVPVTVGDISATDITGIELKDQQWKDAVDGTLLERGKMPEYTYKNSNKESYKPVLAKVWIGETEYTVGDQNVVAAHTYNPDPVTAPKNDCSVSVSLTIGGYTGTISQTYKVKAVSFKETDVTWPTSLTYAPAKEFNEAATNATSVAGLTKFDGDNGDKAQYRVDVTTVNDKTYVVVTGMNEYAGTTFQKEVTVSKYNLANAYVAPIEDQIYTGSDVEPAVTVKYNNEKGSELSRGTDYEVTYQKNRDAGSATVIITGKGKYEGTKTVTFNIVSKTFTKDITNAFDAALTSVTYNAKEQKPVDKDITISGSLKLKYLSDFSTSYVNNVDAGTATVTIKGAGNYAGATYTKTFTINKADLSNIADKDITVADTTYSKDMFDKTTGNLIDKTVKPSVTVKFNGTTVREGVDYDIEYASDGTNNAGNRRIKVTLKANNDVKNSNFSGTKVVYGKVISKELSAVTIPSIPSQVYTGSAYTLNDIKLSDGTLFKNNIKDGKTPLTLDADYYVSAYKNNTATGTATVLLAGKGDYKGTVTVTFPIDAQEMNAKFVYKEGATDFDGVPDLEYNYNDAESKKGITHAKDTFRVVLTADSGSDKKGTPVDTKKYTIKYTENKAVGTATIEAVGKDGYSLNAKTTFKITPKAIKDLSSSDVTVEASNLHYTGEEQKPKVTVNKTVDGHKLVEGTDYEVSYKDNVAATDKAQVIIKGLGNYVIGTDADKAAKNEGYSQKFNIGTTDIVNSNVTVKDVPYAGGVQVTPDVTIVNPYSGKELVQGTDYTVALKGDNTTEVGTSTVEVALTAVGKENYTISGDKSNTMKFNFKITAKDLAKVNIAPIADQAVTGEQIKPAVTVTNGNTKLVEGKDYEVSYGENKEIGEGTVTIKALSSNKNYTGSQTVKFNIVKDAPVVGKTEISSVKVVGNKATVILSGDAEGASGYDYVISTDKNCTTSKDYDAISKNQVQTSTAFKYVQKGTYYAYCHAWTRDKNGKKVFGEWSEGKAFKVKATTPAAPVITEVKVKGSTITVTYNKVSNVAGYDVVLGTSSKNDNGELRPYRYGDHKILNINKNKVTVQFKNVPKKNWVVGMRSFTKDPDTNKKVFSRWSNLMPANMK